MLLTDKEVVMARTLDTFPAPATQRHPWQDWLDGSPWQLFPGEDFTSTPSTLIASARAQAKRRGGKVRTRRVSEHGRETIVLQFERH
jgi:hypothetical protein